MLNKKTNHLVATGVATILIMAFSATPSMAADSQYNGSLGVLKIGSKIGQQDNRAFNTLIKRDYYSFLGNSDAGRVFVAPIEARRVLVTGTCHSSPSHKKRTTSIYVTANQGTIGSHSKTQGFMQYTDSAPAEAKGKNYLDTPVLCGLITRSTASAVTTGDSGSQGWIIPEQPTFSERRVAIEVDAIGEYNSEAKVFVNYYK